MPVEFFASFCGGAYQVRSPNIAADQAINLYLETTTITEEVKQLALYGTPGLKLLATAVEKGCRGLWSQDGLRTFAVIGPTLYEVNVAAASLTARGAIAMDSNPVSMVSNGRGGEQLLIVGGGKVYVLKLTTNVLTTITLPLTNAPVMAAYMDTYFLLTEANTIRVWYSALNDGTSWPAANFFSRSDVSDNVVGIAVRANRLWVFGTRTTELFYDSGSATTPFLPYPGTAMQKGAVGPWAITAESDTLVWVERNVEGQALIVAGGSPADAKVISTPAISFLLSSYPTLTDLETFSYQQEGHPFVGFTSPSGDATWVYDAREAHWHQRETFDAPTATSHRWRVRGLAATDAGVLVGDSTTGALYTLDLETFTENGVAMRRVRRAPYLSTKNQWLFLDSVEVGGQFGVGLQAGQGVSPALMLRISRDAGHTFGPPNLASFSGAQGQYRARALWRRLGRVRADRLVFEVSQSDPVRTVWGPGAWVKFTPGSEQL